MLQAVLVVAPLLRWAGPHARAWIDHQFAAPPHYEVTYTRAALLAVVTFSRDRRSLVFVGIYMLQDSLDIDPGTRERRAGELLVPRLRELQLLLGVLVAALTVAAGVFSTVLARMGERQRGLSRRESLTGCFNRRAFYELFPREVERARRLGQGVSLVFLDIDHFKSMNDHLGHETGDHVLQQLAARLRGIIRETDLLFRWGGEEFVMLLPHTGPAEAPALGERIRAAVAERPFAAGETQRPVSVTVSVGVAGGSASPGSGCPDRARGRRVLPRQGRRPQPRRGRADRGMRDDITNESRHHSRAERSHRACPEPRNPLHPPLVRALLAAAAIQVAPAAFAAPASPPLTLDVGGGRLRVEFCAEDVVRVAFAPEAATLDRRSLAAGERRCEPVELRRTETAQAVTLASREAAGPRRAGERARRASSTRPGRPVLAEQQRSLLPAQVQGEHTYHVRQEWQANADEALLRPRPAPARPRRPQGLRPRPLAAQRDGRRAVPGLEPRLGHPVGQHLVHALRRSARAGAHPGRRSSSTPPASPAASPAAYHAGRGLRDGWSRARRPRIDIEIAGRHEAAEPAHPPRAAGRGPRQRALGGRRRRRASRRPPVPTYSNSGIKMWVDDRLVVDHWRQGWLPVEGRRHGALRGASATTLKLEWSKDQGMETVQLLWKPPSRAAARRRSGPRSATASTTTSSTAPSSTGVVAGYRAAHRARRR